jgi:hypothetical protein
MCSTMLATLPALFALVVFGAGSCIFAQVGLAHNPPIYTSFIAGVTDLHHRAQVLPGLASNHNPPISTSQVAGDYKV